MPSDKSVTAQLWAESLQGAAGPSIDHPSRLNVPRHYDWLPAGGPARQTSNEGTFQELPCSGRRVVCSCEGGNIMLGVCFMPGPKLNIGGERTALES